MSNHVSVGHSENSNILCRRMSAQTVRRKARFDRIWPTPGNTQVFTAPRTEKSARADSHFYHASKVVTTMKIQREKGLNIGFFWDKYGN